MSDLIIQELERRDTPEGIPSFSAGDTVLVHQRVIEGAKERIQIFKGVVIALKGRGSHASFTVRKISSGVGVERTFPLNSPSIAKIEVEKEGRVRRAKLYYLRERTGKAARIREKSSENTSKKAQA